MVYVMTDELYHHGIKGQKWGIRRYQNPDGTLTVAGRARRLKEINNDPDVLKRKADVQQAKENYKIANARYNQVTRGGVLANEQATKDLVKASNAIVFAKQDLKDEKLKKRMSIVDIKEKSKTRLKYEEAYKKKGMTSEEAELAAYRRERTTKILKVAAGVTVAAAVAYGGSKYAENNFDKVIRTNTLLSRVSTSDTAGVQDAFYAVFTKNKKDVSKYSGLYANQIHFDGMYGHKRGTPVYEKTIRTVSKMKMASPKSAMKSLQKLVDDDINYKLALADILQKHGDRKQAEKLLNTGKVSKDVYERMNVALGSAAKKSDVAKKFYSELSAKGYNAIKDMNDSKYSGFYTKMPVIVFDAKSKVFVDNVRELSGAEIKRQNARAWADIGQKAAKKSLSDQALVGGIYVAEIGAIGAVIGVASGVQKKKEEKAVAEYRKEHPNSKLTYKQIVRNYYDESGTGFQ